MKYGHRRYCKVASLPSTIFKALGEPCGGGQLKGHLVVYGRRDQLADPY